ncbi:MAG: family 16 glycosylhydrolase [Bacteroidota bacterium]
MKEFRCTLPFLFYLLFSSGSLTGQTPTGWPGCVTSWPAVLLDANHCFSGSWKLVFEDDFNGTSLDTNTWIPRTPWGDPPDHSTYNLPENIVLENGNARLNVLQQPGYYPVPWCDQNATPTWYDWTGAEMWTFERFQYGRFEMKCTVPRGVGYWPAFWLYMASQDHSEEIDIFEFWNEWIIYWLNWMDWSKMSKNQHLSIHHCDWEDASEYMGWEFWTGSWIFSLEWDPFTVKWFVKEESWAEEVLLREDYHFFKTTDNIPITGCAEIQPDMYYLVNTSFPTIPMGLIASFKMGYDRLGPNGNTPDSGSFIIDYVRVYQKEDCGYVIRQCSMGDVANYPTNLYAREIILGNDSEPCLNEIRGIDFNFLASEKIVLKPTFHIKPELHYQVCGNTDKYSSFTAKITSCSQDDKLPGTMAGTNSDEKPRWNTKYSFRKPVTDAGQGKQTSGLNSCKVFPNPTHGDITLFFPEATDVNMIKVYNNFGVLIKQESNIGEIRQVKINLTHIPGIFLLIIHLRDATVIQKKVVID